MLAETTKNKPLVPYCVNLPKFEPFVQSSPFQDLPQRQPPTRDLAHTATLLSSHTMQTHAESIKHAGGKTSQFNSALHDPSSSRHIKLTGHLPSHHNESHNAHLDVFLACKIPGSP